ncbi:MAG: hypothetical protein ACJ0OL_04020 [Dehalococcoidia bacterium]
MTYKKNRLIAAVFILFFELVIVASCMKTPEIDKEYVENTYDVLIASSVIDIKTTRIPFVIIGSRGEYLKPDLTHVRLRHKSSSTAKLVEQTNLVPKYYSIVVTEDHIHRDGEIHVHENDLGIYVLNVEELNYPGEWQLELTVRNLEGQGKIREIQTTFLASEEVTFLPVGSRVPLMSNRTLGEGFALEELSTHPNPDPAMYTMTVEKAINKNRPSVVIFSTPAYCQSKVCGPVLDIVMSVKNLYESEIDFIHVEPFDLQALIDSGDFLLSPPAREWGLPSEPWVIIVDRYGKVVAKFEGIISRTELIEVCDTILDSK